MNRQSQTGFTLIELLVVIVIIMILISLLTVGIMKARGQIEVQRARVEVQSLYNAFGAYYADYGTWPYTNETVVTVDNTLVQMLGGANLLGNTKQRLYLAVQAGQTNSAGDFVDPWGNVYRVVFDGTGSAADGVLANPFAPAGYSNRVPCIIWSNGPDGQFDSNGELSDRNKDNLKSY